MGGGGTGYAVGEWVRREVERGLVEGEGNEVALSSGEYHLLHALVRHPRQVMSRARLLDMVRGREADIFDRAIDNLVSRLRKKIEEDPARPQFVKTVWGGGHTLACEVKRQGRSEARRVGNEGASTWRARGWQYQLKKKQ